jgi:hypothetical protein
MRSEERDQIIKKALGGKCRGGIIPLASVAREAGVRPETVKSCLRRSLEDGGIDCGVGEGMPPLGIRMNHVIGDCDHCEFRGKPI